MVIHNFYCTQCGTRGIPIPRKNNKQREAGHLKKMYCLCCDKEVNFVEINDKYTYNDFLVEFENHNFNKDGTRKMKYGELRHLLYMKDKRKESGING